MRARKTSGGTGNSGDIMNSPSTRRSVMPSARCPAHSRQRFFGSKNGAEEGQAADVVEMRVRQVQVSIQTRVLQGVAEVAQPGAAVEDQQRSPQRTSMHEVLPP